LRVIGAAALLRSVRAQKENIMNEHIGVLLFFLAGSGVYSIVVSLVNLTKLKQSPSDSALHTKFFKFNAPVGFTYGILSLLIVVSIVYFNDQKVLKADNDRLKSDIEQIKKENEALKIKYSNCDKATFTVYLNSDIPISIFGGTVVVTFVNKTFSKSYLKFNGISGAAKLKNGPFDNAYIEFEYGAKCFIKLDNAEIWGINIFQTYNGVSLELYKI
jgi:hypothetical protein